MGSYRSAVKNIIDIQSLRSKRHGMHLHLNRHVGVLYQSLAFQHLFLCEGNQKAKRGNFFFYSFFGELNSNLERSRKDSIE